MAKRELLEITCIMAVLIKRKLMTSRSIIHFFSNSKFWLCISGVRKTNLMSSWKGLVIIKDRNLYHLSKYLDGLGATLSGTNNSCLLALIIRVLNRIIISLIIFFHWVTIPSIHYICLKYLFLIYLQVMQTRKVSIKVTKCSRLKPVLKDTS